MNSNATLGKFPKLPPLILAVLLQFAPLARFVQTSPLLAASPVAIIVKWIAAAAAVAGACHAVSGASASIGGVALTDTDYLTLLGPTTNSITITNGTQAIYTVILNGLPVPPDPGVWFQATGLPPGVVIDTNHYSIDAPGLITNMPTTVSAPPGVYNVSLKAGFQTMTTPNFPLAITIVGVSGPSISGPVNQYVPVGGTANFSVSAFGDAPLSYQWRKGATNIPSQTASNLTLVSVITNDSGLYSAVVTNNSGSLTSAPAILSVQMPVAITGQPTNRTVGTGSNCTFVVTATGSPVRYQWFFNGAPQNNRTNATNSFTVNNVSQQGNYSVLVSNDVSFEFSSNAFLTVNAPPSSVTVSPATNAGFTGYKATFLASANGSAPLSYQWRKGTTNLPGENATNLVLPFLTTNDAGNYFVVVTNAFGSRTNTVAGLLNTYNGPRSTAAGTNTGFFTLEFDQSPGATYRVETANNPNSNAWQLVSNLPAVGSPTHQVLQFPITNNSKLYRQRVTVP